MAISAQQLTIYLYSAYRAVIFAIAQLSCSHCLYSTVSFLALRVPFSADRTNGRAYATVLRPCVVCLWRTYCC